MTPKEINDRQFKINTLLNVLEDVPLHHHFRINRCYNLVVSPAWKIEDSVLDDYHLLFVKSGKGEYVLDGCRQELTRGILIFSSRGVKISSSQDLDDPPYIVPVRFDIYDNNAGEIVDLNIRPFWLSLSIYDIRFIEQLFDRLFKYYSPLETDGQESVCSSIIHQILMEVITQLRKPVIHRDERIESVCFYLRQNPSGRFSLDELAKSAGLSKKYFSRMFRKQVGVSPMEYQLKVRMNFAGFLLEDTGRTIKQIAFDTGYDDQYTFSRQFKKVFNVSPSIYRKIRQP